ncbi:MAG: FUSC family protein [Burkholderiaceae bacterium]|nr:FUSC family protein [Burkholderiaceae bacterium]
MSASTAAARYRPPGPPAHLLNGLAVGLGIGAVQLLFGALAGHHAAQLAVAGAVYASLADLPVRLQRNWRSVLAAGALGCASALALGLLRPWPPALAPAIAAIGFVAAMGMAWGARAGPISFAPILSIVFTMAQPAHADHWLAGPAWNAAGALAYLAWSLAASGALQPRYRSLALSAALRATARLLRSRADALDAPLATGTEADARALRTWIDDEAQLAERLQAARDLLFAAPDTARVRRETAILLHAIDLRDILTASRLDVELLGDDAPGRAMRSVLAGGLRRIAADLDLAEASLRGGVAPAPPDARTAARAFDDLPLEPGDARLRLLPALAGRLAQLDADVGRIRALLDGRGDTAPLPLSRAQLGLFVAPEGWPLGVLRANLTPRSPVFRHAVRTSLALAAAYLLALSLPWTSHPYWLVLGVAVVLRGNLEQTLSRRNARVLGTVAGCLLVLALARLDSPTLLASVFPVSAGVAHAFVAAQYLVTAAAGTVTALLQAHLLDPSSGFAIFERLADTLLGALLAWGFSYVLPSWERRALPRAIERALRALREYAAHSLAVDADAALAQRLARRSAYDALGAIAGAVKRSAYEPPAVRPPIHELTALLDHGQRLMAHLSMIRLMLAQGGAPLRSPDVLAALRETDRALQAALGPGLDVEAGPRAPDDLALLPAAPPTEDLLPWLSRRLGVAAAEGPAIARAARAALGRLGNARWIGYKAESGGSR